MSDATLRAAMAERAARAGGLVARERFREELRVDTKGERNDLVTGADRDAQRQVIATVTQEFPGAAFVCEEESRPPGTGGPSIQLLDGVPESGDVWVVDPIDGTANYVREIRFWATSVAALSGGKPAGVATYMPSEDDIYTAGPESVSRNGESMAVSPRDDPGTFAVALIGRWPTGRRGDHAALFRAAADRFGDLRRMGSMQGALALVASGSLDAALMPGTPLPWDAIAGVHLVRRAGGTATDLQGDRWTNGATGLVVSNGNAHDRILDTITKGLGIETAD